MPYHKLDVYQKAYKLALELHKKTLEFPNIEQYELAKQLRRSSKSIPVNIAEGMSKQESNAEVSRFVRIAMGSCDETRVWLEFAKDLNYITSDDFESYNQGYQEVGRMLQGILKRYSG